MVNNNLSVTDMFHIQVAKINADFNIFPLVKFHVSPNLYNTSQHVLYVSELTFFTPLVNYLHIFYID